MKGVQCYELFRGIALKNHAFSFFIFKTKTDTKVAVAVLVRNLRIYAKRRCSKLHVRAILETCAFIV